MSPEGESPKVIPFNRERRHNPERGVILLSALQVAKGKIDDLRMHFGKKDLEGQGEVELIAVAEKYTTNSLLSLCFQKEVPPQFDGPLMAIIAVSGRNLETQLLEIVAEGVQVVIGRRAQKVVCNAFGPLRDFIK